MEKGKNGKIDGVANTVDPESVQKAKIKLRIATITKQQTDFRLHAERQMAAMDGAIQALEELLEPEPVPEPPKEGPVPDMIKEDQEVAE